MKLTIIDVKSGKEIAKEIEKVDWDEKEEVAKYEHYMLKEILEQPKTILKAIEQDDKELINVALEILRARDVIFTACGTSRYAAIIGRYLLSKIANKFSDVIIASEFQYFCDSIDKNTLVVAISQSGETADVLEGVKKAKEKEAKIIAITNVKGSSLAKIGDRVFYLNCGPEVAVAATKSFTAQLTILYLFAFASVNKIQEGKAKLKEIARKVEEVIKINNLKDIAFKLKDCKDFYYIARGIDFAIASEGALKLKEISYAHAEGMPAGELKHGTLSLIEQGTPVVVICPKDYTYEETINNAIEAKTRGGLIIGVSDEQNNIFDYWIKIPKVEEIFYPIVSVIPLQLLAYYLAVAKGNNPDKPRHLAKSVTVL
jgi:glucosamine--fructose-6-phosphate aminotransferase (isomerizing)